MVVVIVELFMLEVACSRTEFKFLFWLISNKEEEVGDFRSNTEVEKDVTNLSLIALATLDRLKEVQSMVL